jgi:ATP-dependent RNA helicase DDX19/DBP5
MGTRPWLLSANSVPAAFVAKAAMANSTEKSAQPEDDDLQVFLADSSIIYRSAKTFEDFGLKPEILKGVYGMGFQIPSRIQATALPMLLSDPPQNLIGQSQAGTGKTATFALNILQRVDVTDPSVQAVVLAPARELARQILDRIRELGKYTGITTALAVPDIRAVKEPIVAHVIVGTPGNLAGHIGRKNFDVKKVKVYVIDEADAMLESEGGLQGNAYRIRKYLVLTKGNASRNSNCLVFSNISNRCEKFCH